MIAELLEQIKHTNSSTEKVRLLKFYSHADATENQDDLKALFQFVYSKDITFDITSKQIKLNGSGLNNKFPIHLFNKILITDGRNAKIQLIQTFLTMHTKLVQEYFLRGLDRDLGIGISVKTINKAFPGLLKEMGIMLATKATEEDFTRLFADTPWVYVNLKIDGIRATCEIKDGVATFTSRDGHVLPEFLLENIKRDVIRNFGHLNITLDGEIYASDFQKLMKIVQRKTIDLDNTIIRNQCKYAIFDVIDTERLLVERVFQLSTLKSSEYVSFVPYVKLASSYPLLLKLARKYIDQGKEGIMVKHPQSKYEFKRSKMWLKFKDKHSEDVRVICCIEGDKGTKYEGMLGAFTVDFYGVKVNVGSGFTDEQRKSFWMEKDKMIDKLIEITYMEVTKDKSLRHPVFERLRIDRS